ncbi:MAG: acyltransferase [Lachnospiraceae bacterium]|nr:acyltransferase [Lachnospiraceae bacterium]
MEKKHYGAIDGLKAFSCIGIALMHIKSNTGYEIGGFLYNQFIGSLGNLVYLFMIISAFGMCCGYYEGILENRITVGEFYSKRYRKIWPCFAVLCFLDLAVSPGAEAVYEVFANLTLCFGLLPDKHMSVIGVGWFLGLAFVFYLLFPFFCWLLSHKMRAWFSFGIAFLFHFLCKYYFKTDSINICYSGVYFMAGGLIYLYRIPLEKAVGRYRWIFLSMCLAGGAAAFVIGISMPVMLILFSFMVICTLGGKDQLGGVSEGKAKLLESRVAKLIGGFSMEIYLSHMLVFRVVERLGLLHMFSIDWLNYATVSCVVVSGSLVFSIVMKKGMQIIGKEG